MEKVNLEIIDFEDKKTKAGKRFTRFNTDQGWMSCFDAKACEALKEIQPGVKVCVEIAVDEEKGFKNIRGISKGSADTQPKTQPEAKKEPTMAPIANKPAFNQASMYVAYAKDVFVTLYDNKSMEEGKEPVDADILMTAAIDLIKQAKTAFE
jgi:hypothetical protein